MTSVPGAIGGESSLPTAAQGAAAGAGAGAAAAAAPGDTAAVNMEYRAGDYDHDYECDCQHDGDEDEGEEEEEEEVVMDEEEMLQMLDQMEPPLSVCQRLFKAEEEEGENQDAEEKGGKGDGNDGSWLVLSASQRSSLRQRGFVVLDALAPAALAAEAYDEATARAASGSLAPAHGGGAGTTGSGATAPSDITSGDLGPSNDGRHAALAAAAQPPPPPQVTGYVGSVRDDLTAFVSAEREEEAAAAAAAAGCAGAVGRTLAILARLGEDLRRMVRLKGRVEHQLAVYPAGMRARYERHRDAYPDDGYDDESNSPARAEGGVGNGDSESGGGSGSGSVSFRRVTAICYLRGSGSPWQPQDGGVLRVYPPATSKDEPDAGGGDSRVVFKFASQLDLSEDTNAGQQEREQQQGTVTSGGCCSGGESDGRDGGGGGVGGGGRVGDEGVGQRQDFVDVAPLAGRAVVFLSGAVEHEVLPVTGALPRAALTTWFH